ncbi:hypothetical protein F5883DRAFT_552554 [Diaporthe sp. PMI_573]|nr:hypothetical protein F5883DRAFT_552554 [Diaporthaceae sp. PMI_573]
MNRLLRRWVFLSLKIPTITTTVFQLLDLGHGQENRCLLETNHPGMWIISQGHPFRDSCGVREDQLPVLRVRTGVSDGVLFVMCMSDGPAMIGGASQLPSKDLEPALHGAGEFGRHAVSPIITARKERPSLSILSCRGKACNVGYY